MIEYTITPLSYTGRTITVSLKPVNDDQLTELVRTIEIPEESLTAFKAMSFDDQLLEIRKTIVHGNGGYQSDWNSQKQSKELLEDMSESYETIIGKEFFAVTEPEVEEPNPPQHSLDEVVF